MKFYILRIGRGCLIKLKGMFMKRPVPILCLLILTMAYCTRPAYDFRFFAIGDMPYHLPDDFQRFERLMQALNEEDPSFTVHVGDIKGGGTQCSDEYFLKIYNYFQQFQHPLIYTPGDNEWTDCHRSSAGGYDPLERLDKIRKTFYRGNRSLGSKTLSLTTQNNYHGYEKFVENAIWNHQDITFGTLHVVGSNNNYKLDSSAINTEHQERDQANTFWLEEIFRQAKSKQSLGLVIFLHAALNYQDSTENGFRDLTETLRVEAMAFEKPMLLIYGDHHRFLIEKPLKDDEGRALRYFTSLMVFGDKDIQAVEIRVDKNDEALFEIRQYFVDDN